jgi:hypothetical protein
LLELVLPLLACSVWLLSCAQPAQIETAKANPRAS